MRQGFISVQTDTKEFRETVRGLMRFRHMKVPAFVRWRAGILVKDLTSFTPPRGKHPSIETWAQQKKMGQMAVRRDLLRAFWKLTSFVPAAFAGSASRIKEWRKMIQAGDLAGLNAVLEAVDIKNRGVVAQPDASMHQSAKKRGRIPEGFSPPWHVISAGGLESYIRSVQARVGEWKHGWMRSAQHLGVKGLPNWVKDQRSSGGRINDQSNNRSDSYIELENNAAGTAQGSASAIVGAAVKINEVKMKIELEKMLAHEFSKASAK